MGVRRGEAGWEGEGWEEVEGEGIEEVVEEEEKEESGIK